MNRRVVFCLSLILCLVIGWFVADSIRASSQIPTPMTVPIKDEATAISFGRAIALTNVSAGTRENQVVFEEVRKMGSSKFSTLLKASGSNVNLSTILGSKSSKDIWLVTFSGLFSPKHIPTGIETPEYSKIDIYLDGSDGIVIGVYMHD
jgi:hypothetical protein